MGLGVDHPPPSRAEIKERVELYLYSPPPQSGVLWPVQSELYLHMDDKYGQILPVKCVPRLSRG